jgi:hypothetical protein
MSAASVESIARTVLYEGYSLYPYRASSAKNRKRWTLGGLFPRVWCESSESGDAWRLQCECLALGAASFSATAQLRFLHISTRESDGWEEAEERHVELTIDRSSSDTWGAVLPFSFAEHRSTDDAGRARSSRTVAGRLSIAAVAIGDGALKLTIVVENMTDIDRLASRGEALRQSFAAAHVVVHARGGELVSLLDPPDALRAASTRCENVGAWPVLVGREGAHDTMLASPIILYDYPRVADESPGDLFDGTEIDEILSLRILTLTDEEKREARALDPRARALIDRTEALDANSLARLHGAVRSHESIDVGDHVRIAPRRRADIFDIALAGRAATVVSVEQDFEGRVLYALTVDDDPGADLGADGQPGHRFFFGRDEISRLR